MNGKERFLSLLRFENSPDGRETRWLLFNVDRIWNGSEKEMRGRCGIKFKKGGQMIKYSRWKGCERVGVKRKQEDDGMVTKIMKWDGKSRDLREVRLVKTSGEREERWLEWRSEGGRKWNEETREWTEEIIQDTLRKWDHQTHHHQETRWSLSTSMCWRNDWWSGREWNGGKMKEGYQRT